MFNGERVVDAVSLWGSGLVLDISMTQVMRRMDQNGQNGEWGKNEGWKMLPKARLYLAGPAAAHSTHPRAVGLTVLQPSRAGRRSGGCCHQGALNKGDQ